MTTEERRERALAAAKAWQESGRPPATKGVGKGGMSKDVLSPDEVRALLDACGKSTTGIRNAAMLATLYGTAIRISEACALRPADVELSAERTRTDPLPAAIHVNKGKGSRERGVGIRADMEPYLTAWAERRKALGLNGRQPFFCTVTKGSLGRPTLASYWRHRLHTLAGKAGIDDKRVHPHALRRTAATHMRDAGVPLDVIQDQLGHANLATTQAYLAGRATSDHLRTVNEWGTEALTAPEVPVHRAAADVLAVADLAAARYVQLPPEVREQVSAADYIAGTVSIWRTGAASAP